MIDDDISNWVNQISQPESSLGNMSVCPYARSTEYKIIETDGSDIQPPPWDFELIIYKLPDTYSQDDLYQLATEYNKINPLLVFLPDHKDKNTFINGIQTNNGKYNLLLCQWRDNLEKARNKLKKTNYYTFWNSEYLKEILET